MSQAAQAEVKWDVASPELLRELIAVPAAARSPGEARPRRASTATSTTTRPTARWRAADVICRFRLGADDRRVLTVTLAAPAAELRVAGVRARPGGRAAGRERGRPKASRPGGSGDARAAGRARGRAHHARRRGTMAVERALRAGLRRRDGAPRAAVARVPGAQARAGSGRESPIWRQVAAAMRAVSGTRSILESKLARAQRMVATLEGEALARSLGTGRAVTLLALDGGAIAFQRKGDALTLPIADGQGEAASRHLLRATFGSAVGDLALLGTASGRGAAGRLQEVWVVRRLRLDGELADGIEWLHAVGGHRRAPDRSGFRTRTRSRRSRWRRGRTCFRVERVRRAGCGAPGRRRRRRSPPTRRSSCSTPISARWSSRAG